MEKEKFVIKLSLSVRADRYVTVEGCEIPSDKIYTDRKINAAAFLSDLYYQYIQPIWLRKFDNGVQIESCYGNAVLEFGGDTTYVTPPIGFSYASGVLDLYLKKC